MKFAFRVLRVSSAFMLSPCLALAQAAPSDARTESVARLREAEKLAQAGSAAEACQKYGESYSLDAQLDALLPWADCLEKSGKLASAYAAFLDAADVARRASDKRWLVADGRAQQLRPRLSYLTVDVPQDRRLPALSIERDGFRLGSSSWGVPMPVDPGSHVVVVRAYGYRDWQTTFEVQADGAAPYLEVPLLEKLPPDAETAAPAAAPAPAPAEPMPVLAPPAPLAALPAPAAPKPVAASGPGGTRVAALVAGGVGVVGLGLGFYFMGKTHSTLSERDGICPTSKNCEPGTNDHLAQLTAQATNQQRAEIAFFAVAGAAAVIGTALWLVPKQHGTQDRAALVVPVVAPGGGGLLLLRQF